MQQINENLLVLNVGDPFDDSYAGFLKIFLSGSTDLSGIAKTDWQTKVINAFTRLTDPYNGDPRFNRMKFILMNPKIPIKNPTMDLSNQEFVSKVQWELEMMDRADGIFCNFLKKSQSPAAIYGFLLNNNTGKTVVRCPMEYQNYAYINMVCIQRGIPLLGDSGTVVDVLNKFFEVIPKFQEVANYGL